jgi:hypothetical protein
MSDAEPEWTDLIVGERMRLDQEFNEKVAASNFSNQQWGLIMTAVEFEVEHPDDPERARLVADTSKLDAVLPELDRMDGAGMGGPGGPGGDPRAGSSGGDSGGLFDGIKQALGLGRGENEREQLAAAEELAQMYADDLQAKLESASKWDRVRSAAAGGSTGTGDQNGSGADE